jgi:hypothetical protein
MLCDLAQLAGMFLPPDIDGWVSLNRTRESEELAHLVVESGQKVIKKQVSRSTQAGVICKRLPPINDSPRFIKPRLLFTTSPVKLPFAEFFSSLPPLISTREVAMQQVARKTKVAHERRLERDWVAYGACKRLVSIRVY